MLRSAISCLGLLLVLVLASGARGEERAAVKVSDACGLLRPGGFVHIPGPNPILLPGPAGSWDEGVIEAADAFHDGPTYYFYYHGTGQGQGYRLGAATASHPLGPFRKHGDKPILDLGPPGAWDDRHVACAMVLREGEGKYWMWYSGAGMSPAHAKWSIGLAAASHPLGPWRKYEGNPILVDFGYVGAVVKASGKHRLYVAHPIGSTGPDYSPISLAIADAPTGPWIRWPKNPVLKEGPKGTWDDGGFSEAEVFAAHGLYHLFYGGAKIHPQRIRTQESIGYAWSADGCTFTKHPQNPVAPREANPNAAALAEVHSIFEPPFVYLYHTLRYLAPRTPADQKKFPMVENLGVQVLVMELPFELDMPVIHGATLGPGRTTDEADSPPISLHGVSSASATVECFRGEKAPRRIRMHVLESHDGRQWKTADELDAEPPAAGQSRRTFPLKLGARFVKVLASNPDPAAAVSNLSITVRLRGG